MSQNLSNGAGDWVELTSEFGQLSKWLLPVGEALTPVRLVHAAHQATPVADAVGLTVVTHGQPRTTAATARIARRIDHLQQLTRQGPCLDEQDDDFIRVDDLAHDDRWPVFGKAVVRDLSVHNVLSVRLHLNSGTRAALNMYAAAPGVLTDREVTSAAAFAALVALALDAEQARTELAQLQVALATSRQIGTAIGILMARRLLKPEDAFVQLRESSQRLNRKLRDVAFDVIETGELPDAPRRPGPRPGPHARWMN